MTEARTPTGNRNIDNELAAEANHRISNHLTLLLSILRLQEAALSGGREMFTGQDVRGILQSIYGKIASIAHLHRMLAYQGHSEKIDLGNYLNESCSILITSFSTSVEIAQKLDPNCYMTPERARSVALIVNEIIMNAIKHSRPRGGPVEIRLDCRSVPEQKYMVEIHDDGDGLPKGFDPMADGGMGFTLIRSLAESLGASLKVDSSDVGTSFRLTVDAL